MDEGASGGGCGAAAVEAEGVSLTWMRPSAGEKPNEPGEWLMVGFVGVENAAWVIDAV